MKNNHFDTEAILHQVTEDIRTEAIDSSVINAAADRVWARLNNELTRGETVMSNQTEQSMDHITGCADFQTLMPGFLAGELSGARKLLLEDHTRECLPCRKALKVLREANAPAVADTQRLNSGNRFQTKLASLSSTQRTVMRWGIAAVLVAGFGLAAMPFAERFYYSFKVLNTVVQAANGPVYKVSDTDSKALAEGAQVAKGEKIRTAKEAGAVMKLPDGSLIEMRERSEFWVSENSDGTTIHLERGNIIVQAAKQRNKHLYVATPDSLVSVTGTIFAVNSGTKGSRVSVVEGEVHVNHDGKEVVLHPGDQETTRQSIERVPVKDEFAWSRDANRYVAMLAELKKLRKDIDEQVSRPGVRYSTRLLDLMPENTVFYVAIPNLTQTLAESNKLIQERLAQNPTLKEWWAKEGSAKQVNRVVDQIREFGEYLGSEIVVTVGFNASGQPGEPLVMAELSNPSGFRAYAESKLNQASTEASEESKDNVKEVRHHAPVRFVDDSQISAAQPQVKSVHDGMVAWIHDDLLVAAPDLASVQSVAGRMKAQSSTRASNDSFRKTIASLYQEGAGLIIAANLEKLIASGMASDTQSPRASKEKAAAQQLGLTNFKYFIAEVKEKDGKPFNRAVVTFNEANRGVSNWLAAPGPMGALEFISPDASVVAAFVVKKPSAMVDDIFAALNATDAKFAEQFKQFEADHGVSIRNDLAEPLGGEFAFAIDGPVVPLPAWKVVFEVYDQAHLQQSLEKLTTELNTWAATQGKKGVGWEKAEVGGRTFYTIRSLDYGLEINYAFVNGYFVAGPSRAMVERAIRYRESGYSIKQSPKFTAALPADGNANFSALFYSNFGSVVGPLAKKMRGFSDKLPEEQKQMMKTMSENTPAVLAYAYVYGDRMVFSLSSENGPFGLTPGSLLSLPGQFMLGNIFGKGRVN